PTPCAYGYAATRTGCCPQTRAQHRPQDPTASQSPGKSAPAGRPPSDPGPAHAKSGNKSRPTHPATTPDPAWPPAASSHPRAYARGPAGGGPSSPCPSPCHEPYEEAMTLAVYWAHRVAERFPDGQLYVNLRGFDPGGQVMAPAEAVRRFLDALGVPP